jgi:LysR family transcriptional regulator, glycine cleavage system transcriptional activator
LNARRAFEALARLGNFSAAAESLHVTTVRSVVRSATWQWLGIAPFARSGRRVRLTAKGRDYLHAVQSAFDAVAVATRRLVETCQRRRIVNGLRVALGPRR